MLKVYGSMLCPDCAACCAEFDRNGISYVFLDFKDSLLNLKEFLAIRDSSPAFQQAKLDGKIGIPCIVSENGSVSLQWEAFCSSM